MWWINIVFCGFLRSSALYLFLYLSNLKLHELVISLYILTVLLYCMDYKQLYLVWNRLDRKVLLHVFLKYFCWVSGGENSSAGVRLECGTAGPGTEGLLQQGQSSSRTSGTWGASAEVVVNVTTAFNPLPLGLAARTLLHVEWDTVWLSY